MPADPLNGAAAARHQRAVDLAERALRALEAEGATISFQAVALRAGVSRQWLYTQPALRAGIEQLRDRSPARTARSPHGSEPLKRRCASAWRRCGPRTSDCARRTPASRTSSRSPTASGVARSVAE